MNLARIPTFDFSNVRLPACCSAIVETIVNPSPVPLVNPIFWPLIKGFLRVSNNSSDMFFPSFSMINVIDSEVVSRDKVAVLPYLRAFSGFHGVSTNESYKCNYSKRKRSL